MVITPKPKIKGKKEYYTNTHIQNPLSFNNLRSGMNDGAHTDHIFYVNAQKYEYPESRYNNY